MRRSATHAPAAYLRSVHATWRLCSDISARYSLDLQDAVSAPAGARSAVNEMLSLSGQLSIESVLKKNLRQLSQAIDNAGKDRRLATLSLAEQASFWSECGAGARDFLMAIPNCNIGLSFEPAEFVSTLRSRLCVDSLPMDAWCPLCDAIMDAKGFHSRTCCAGGDMTVNHNLVRNAVFRKSRAAGYNPVLERPGLLLPSRPDDSHVSRRRPADVFLPTWLSGSPAALDIAITAPQRQGVIERAAREALASAKQYADTKRSHLDTARLCRDKGIYFVPFVVESTGALEPGAFKVLKALAKAAAVRSGRDGDAVLAESLQYFSVLIRRAQARALLRRLGCD